MSQHLSSDYILVNSYSSSVFVCIRMQQQKPGPEPSCVSMKSDRSMDRPIDFKDGQAVDER